MMKIDLKSVIMDTKDNWKTSNPTLAKGIFGYESDTNLIKLFDGEHSWEDLHYVSSGQDANQEKDFSDLMKRMANAESEIKLTQDDVRSIHSDVNAIKGSITTLTAKVAENAEKIEQASAKENADVEALTLKIRENAEKILAVQDSVNADKEALKNAEKNIGEVQNIANKALNKADNVEASSVSLVSRINALEEKLAESKKTNVESKVVESGAEAITLNDGTKDFIVSGVVDKKLTVSEAKTVELKGLESNDNAARLSLTASDEISLKDVVLNANYKKATANSVISANGSDYVTVKGLTFGDNSSCYNCLEIGLADKKLPKNVLIDSCTFTGNLSNVAILIFGTQDNAVININNCHFKTVSNMLRLSNKTNAKNVVVNITNCSVDRWDSDPQWVGGIIMQDYTNKTVDEYMKANLFGDKKITINMVNCYHNGEKIVAGNPSEQFGSMDVAKQIAFIWSEYDENAYNQGQGGHPKGIMPYDESRYPTFNIM